MLRVYRPPSVDRLWLWVYYSKIPYIPYSIYLRRLQDLGIQDRSLGKLIREVPGVTIWLVFKSQVPKFGRGKHPRGGPPSLQNKKSPLMKQLSHKDDTAKSPRSRGFRTSTHLESNTAKGCD